MVLMTATLGLVGYVCFGLAGFAFGVFVSVIFCMQAYSNSRERLLRFYNARPLDQIDHPDLFNLVKHTSQQASLSIPEIFVVPTRKPYAFIVGHDSESAALVFSEGILELLEIDELEGVIGHELAHVRNKDLLVGSVAGYFAVWISYIATLPRLLDVVRGEKNMKSHNGGPIGLAISSFIAPLVAIVIRIAISKKREYLADAEAGRITGKFLPLASALEKMNNHPVRLNLDSRPATAHLMVVNPLSGNGMSSLFVSHPCVIERISRLREKSRQELY